MGEDGAIEVSGVVIAILNGGTPVAITAVSASNTKGTAVPVTYVFTFAESGFLNVMHSQVLHVVMLSTGVLQHSSEPSVKQSVAEILTQCAMYLGLSHIDDARIGETEKSVSD